MADSKPGVHVLQLKHVSVPPSMIIGEKFIKWDEVKHICTFISVTKYSIPKFI